jgi:hypothetical protein
MARRIDLAVGCVVAMKKPHACGANAWEVLRLGAEVRARCTACARLLTLPRLEFESRVKRVLPAEPPGQAGP